MAVSDFGATSSRRNTCFNLRGRVGIFLENTNTFLAAELASFWTTSCWRSRVCGLRSRE